MAERIIKLRLPVLAVLLDDKVIKQSVRQRLDLSESTWLILEWILPRLRPFAKATEQLTKESESTLSQIAVLLPRLVKVACNIKDGDTKVIKTMKTTIVKELKTRFDIDANGIMNNLHRAEMVATVLDPRYKSLTFLSDEQKTDLAGYVCGLADKFSGEETKSPVAKKIKVENADDEDDDIFG